MVDVQVFAEYNLECQYDDRLDRLEIPVNMTEPE
jgi:hypothetical protein